MKKINNWIFCVSAFLLILTSCDHKGNDYSPVAKPDPKLVLRSLLILGQDLGIEDLKNIECVAVSTITADDITAKFDYGDEKDEAIGVVVEAEEGVFKVDKEKTTIMKISVPAEKGRHLSYEMEVKVSVQKIPLPVDMGYNDAPQKNGTEETLNLENVELMVQAGEDIIKEVIINDGTKDYKLSVDYVPETKELDAYYIATKVFQLKTDDFTTFTITAKPKDENTYLDTVYTYRLKGTTIPKDNAEFIYIQNGDDEDPYVICDMQWCNEECESIFIESYGAISLKMTARTMSPRASVYVKKIDPLSATEELLEGENEVKLENEQGIHKGSITLFENKPTCLVAYVKAEDNTTTNVTKGKWKVVFNSVDLFWGYDDSKLQTNELRKTANKAYAEIEATKASVVGNKIYIAFGIWEEKLGFKPDKSITEMADYKMLDSYGDPSYGQFTTYQFSVDVSEVNVGNSKEIEIPVMRVVDDEEEPLDEPIKAFTYKVKITMK